MSLKPRFAMRITNEDVSIVCTVGAGTGAVIYQAMLNDVVMLERGMNPNMEEAVVVLGEDQFRSIEKSPDFVAMPYMEESENGVRMCDSYVRADQIAMIWEEDGFTHVCMHAPLVQFMTTKPPKDLIAATGIVFSEQYIPEMERKAFISTKFPNLVAVFRKGPDTDSGAPHSVQ